MNKQWYLLKKSSSLVEATILSGMLEENNIPVQLLNKLDSSYLSFGSVEIYVPIHLKDISIELVNKALLN